MIILAKLRTHNEINNTQINKKLVFLYAININITFKK